MSSAVVAEHAETEIYNTNSYSADLSGRTIISCIRLLKECCARGMKAF